MIAGLVEKAALRRRSIIVLCTTSNVISRDIKAITEPQLGTSWSTKPFEAPVAWWTPKDQGSVLEKQKYVGSVDANVVD